MSDLRYGWRKLRKLATDVSDNLARLQARGGGRACLAFTLATLLARARRPAGGLHAAGCAAPTLALPPPPPPANLQVGFKRELIKEVRAFVADAQAFRRDWEAAGPMAPGLDPMEAVDRLKKFQQMFEVRALPSACGPRSARGGRSIAAAASAKSSSSAHQAAHLPARARAHRTPQPPRRCASASGTATPAARRCLASTSRASPSWSRPSARWARALAGVGGSCAAGCAGRKLPAPPPHAVSHTLLPAPHSPTATHTNTCRSRCWTACTACT